MLDKGDQGAAPRACRVAIIGGGPGGLMTAYRLQQRCPVPFEATIYEASSRLGGKILTKQFASAPVAYEAGAAELYDYSHVGEDPLRELVEELGLTVKPMNGNAVVIDDEVLRNFDDVGRMYGEPARQALLEFDDRARHWMSPQEYYDSDWKASNADPMAGRNFHEELEQVPDEAARKYVRTLVHSDLATEPHRTSASYGLQNYLMNDASYMRLYTIEGGIERLPQELVKQIEARILLREPVVRVERAGGQNVRVFSRRGGSIVSEEYDYVVVALPNVCIPLIEWGGEALGKAIHRHCVHYDHPAHYLRISVLFREIFWESVLQDSYLMLDAFGGCCLYDESSRNGCRTSGVLGWLLAGDAAMVASNHTDEQLIRRALDSLASFLRRGRELFVEGKVHRWIGSVSGLPGGSPALDMELRHIPDPAEPNLFMVGDYLFDSTINGVLDSADYVAECLSETIEARFGSRIPDTMYSAAL
jgi:protoporphyrinogen oxidase